MHASVQLERAHLSAESTCGACAREGVKALTPSRHLGYEGELAVGARV